MRHVEFKSFRWSVRVRNIFEPAFNFNLTCVFFQQNQNRWSEKQNVLLSVGTFIVWKTICGVLKLDLQWNNSVPFVDVMKIVYKFVGAALL